MRTRAVWVVIAPQEGFADVGTVRSGGDRSGRSARRGHLVLGPSPESESAVWSGHQRLIAGLRVSGPGARKRRSGRAVVALAVETVLSSFLPEEGIQTKSVGPQKTQGRTQKNHPPPEDCGGPSIDDHPFIGDLSRMRR